MLNTFLINSYLIFLNFSKTILLCSSVFFMDWVLSQNGLSDVPQEISLKSPNQLKWSTPCKTIGSDYMEVLGSLRREWGLIVDWFHLSLTLILFHGPLCELVPPHLVNIYSNINLVNITSLWDLNNDHEVCMETMIVTNKQNTGMLLSDQYIVFGVFFIKCEQYKFICIEK